jgi:dipeptidyl-peptidase-4
MFSPVQGQQTDSTQLSLERIFSSREFRARRVGPIQWLDGGERYTKLERSETVPKGRDLVAYTPPHNERQMIVPAERLIATGDSLPLQISDYTFSKDKRQLLIFTNTKRVWRYNTRGDYWVLNLKTWYLRQLGGNIEPSTMKFATFSPDGERVAYVQKNNIYVQDIKSGKITALTTSGSKTIINGTFDWVYEEELDLRNGFCWSPDGEKIAYWQIDASGIGVFHMINNTDSIYSFTIPVQYPKVGTTNSAGRVGVVSSKGGKTRWFDIPGDPRNNYIARMEWAASSEEILIQQLNRLQNTNTVMLGNAGTGEVKSIFTDTDDGWVEVVDDLKWLNDGSEFTWVSERDGWRHVYRISRDGQTIKLITPGQYDVVEIENIDLTDGWIYFIASPDKPVQRFLYRSRLDGSGTPERLTKAKIGTHAYNVSPNSRWAFHTWSSSGIPSSVELVELPGHKKIQNVEDNAVLKEKLDVLNISRTEFFRLEIESGIILDGFMIKPPNFDQTKKYPVLFYVYGEPAGQTVRDSWGRSTYLWHQFLAQQGYIVISIDNRGTPAPRGRDWRKSIYRQIGILASADQAAACRIIRNWDFVDPERIAIWGWSGGGSMSLNAIFRYPELYQTALAIAFISDQRIYDTIYQERYMGLPSDNEYGYREGSPKTHAKNLQGNLLIIHGTGDDNCHYQSAELLINELIRHNKMFTAVPYPNRSHGINEGENTRRHVFETLTWYLKNHTPPGPVE